MLTKRQAGKQACSSISFVVRAPCSFRTICADVAVFQKSGDVLMSVANHVTRDYQNLALSDQTHFPESPVHCFAMRFLKEPQQQVEVVICFVEQIFVRFDSLKLRKEGHDFRQNNSAPCAKDKLLEIKLKEVRIKHSKNHEACNRSFVSTCAHVCMDWIDSRPGSAKIEGFISVANLDLASFTNQIS
ncbi:hypothetical protein EGR_08231 [Echinococcus granulosus]|uniref:Uncharacterized protein n=1 Tax=Echinococcus granulosus TaxID=6210 RepID=W6U6T3_ECHGR|nr:hypothetical protein EGR_08231 [Echinococcus granulosus]EUB56925.1 hypothetical protein EGR_08231 [Echinococcus granulosus]